MPTPNQPPSPVAGLILAGGASRRFGSDKALAHLPGEDLTLLDRAIALLGTVADSVSVVAPADRPYPNLVADRYPGEGPLGGVISGLAAIDAPRAIIIAVDQFALMVPTLARLLLAQEHFPAVAYRSGDDDMQPLPFAINQSELPALAKAFETGIRSLTAVLASIGVILLDLDPDDHLNDADRPEDLDSVG